MSIDIEQERNIGRLWSTVTELKTIISGTAGVPGIYSEIQKISKRLEEQEQKTTKKINKMMLMQKDIGNTLNNYFKLERQQTCYGIKALEVFKKEQGDQCKAVEKQSTELKKARLTVIGAIIVALITTVSGIIPIIINKGGL